MSLPYRKSLKELLTHSLVNEDHVTMITKSLLYGTERAKMEHQKVPYSSDFVQALVMPHWAQKMRNFTQLLPPTFKQSTLMNPESYLGSSNLLRQRI